MGQLRLGPQGCSRDEITANIAVHLEAHFPKPSIFLPRFRKR